MSEEKLYTVKNDEGKYWDFEDNYCFLALDSSYCLTTTSKSRAEIVTDEHGGHIVTFIEEPEKVVLTKEQAEIVEEAYDSNYPASYIAGSSDDEKLIMNAYVNGYTVAKEKKYNIKVPHTKDVWYYKESEEYLQTICLAGKELRGKFTESDIERYGLQDCEKVECDNDEQ